MNRKQWQLTLIAVLVTLGMVMSACAAPAPATGTSGEQAAVTTTDEDGERVIRVGFRPNWVEGFNIFPYPTYKAQGDMEPYFYMPLLIHNKDFEAVPWLAKEWELTDNCDSATFHLYEDAEWSDGTPLTAADVKYTFEMLSNAEVMNRNYGWIGEEEYRSGEADEIVGIVIVDDHTVRFEMQEGRNNCTPHHEEYGPRVGIVPKHIFEQFPLETLITGENSESMNPTVVSGPFRLGESERDVFFEAIAVDDWWGAKYFGEPKVDKIIAVTMEPEAQLPALVAGELDVTQYVQVSDIEGLEGNPDLKILTDESLSMLGIQFNRRPDSLPDKIRWAMEYATDRDAIVAAHTLGYGAKTYSFLNNEGAYTADDLEWREYDPEMAKQLIQEAIDEGDWDPDRTILFIDDAEEPIWNLWIEMMREVGLEVEMEIVGLALADKLLAGEYDVTQGGGAGVRGHTLRACYYFHRPLGRNYENTQWYDDEFGTLCKEARATLDEDVRKENLAETTKIWYDYGPWITFSSNVSVWATRANICGVTPNTSTPLVHRGGAEYGLFDWYICDDEG
ncbi:ABC transporter substrate-binding protein [Candidatus Entotheonella palauensis]|uniref:ABC transporter substrate-binding protein n=1 Tax=Candidatus Entotheonella palauensis TaxID=93172 RepID=UPI000B7D2824|nr:ABC transporter substrate-binding protein [Candidatus Entotheonella palauensis]